MQNARFGFVKFLPPIGRLVSYLVRLWLQDPALTVEELGLVPSLEHTTRPSLRWLLTNWVARADMPNWRLVVIS